MQRILLLIVLIVISTTVTNAQVCTGSLGNPVVNNTFGFGRNPGAALPPGKTNYPHSQSTCPDDGNYAIANSSGGCHSGSWHTLPQDHTPNDTAGFMMIVNASFAPGVFYVDTVNTLCASTTYEFAAWILNIGKPGFCGGNPISPKVTFSIETLTGVVIKTYTTTDIPFLATPTWAQYGTFFSTPAGVTGVVIKMINNAPGGCGNDLALDDITFRPCGPQVTANVGGATTTTVCSASTNSTLFSGNVSTGYANPFYQWQESLDNGITWTNIAGATSVNYTKPPGAAEGTYLYRLFVTESFNSTNASCGTFSNTVTYIVGAAPIPPAFTATVPDCTNKTVTFTDNPQNPPGSITKWIWNFGDGSPIVNATTNAPQTHTYANAGTYFVTLQVEGTGACPSTVFQSTIVIPSSPAFDFTFTSACTNQPVQFNTTASGTYNWTFGDMTNSVDQNPIKTYTTAGTYTVELQVTFANGCSGTVSHPVTIGALPVTPAYTAPTSACANQSVTFTDQPTNPASSISEWIWNFGDGSPIVTALTNAAQPHTFSTPGTYTVTLQVKGTGGCLSSIYQNTITISAAPVTPSFDAVNTACINQPVAFTDIPTNPSANITQWSWNFGDGSAVVNATTNAPQTHTYTTAGTYNVTLQLTGVGGCVSTAFTKQITIGTAPAVNFTYTGACQNTPVQFTASDPNGTQYNWNFGDGNTSTQANPSHVYTLGGNYNVTLQVTFPGGCVGSKTEVIVIYQLPATSSFTAPASTCLNTPVSFVPQTNNAGSPIVEWNWNFGDGSSPVVATTSATQVHTFTTAGTYEVTLQVKNAGGCASIIFRQTISVSAAPTVDFTFTNSCGANPVQFTSSTNAGTSAAYSWNFGDATTDNIPNPSKVYTAGGTYNVVLRVTNSSGCSSTISHPVTVASAPSALPFNGPSSACVETAVNFIPQPNNPSGITSYNWNFGDGSPVRKVTTNTPQTYTYTTAGSFTVTLQLEGTGGCLSNAFQLPISIVAKPTVDFTFTNSCQNTPVNFNGVSNATNFQWNFGDGGVSTFQNPNHTYLTGGNFNTTLIVRSAAGCIDSIRKTVTVTAKPSINFQIVGADTICSNETITITNNTTVTTGSLSSIKIDWNWPNNIDTTKDSSPALAENYTHTYTAFNTPSTRQAVIRLVGTTGTACDSEGFDTVYLKAIPKLAFAPVAPLCEGDSSFILTNGSETTGMIGMYSYSGTGVLPDTTFSAVTAGPGNHAITYKYNGSNGCSDSITGTISVITKPQISAGPDKAIKEGERVQLEATSDKTYTYLWTPATTLNDRRILRPTAAPRVETTYSLSAVSTEGCAATDTVVVYILREPNIPNVFTPNNDGVNDSWNLRNLSMYKQSRIEVFNRYGGKVFTSYGYSKPWDGMSNNSPVPVGVYYYVIQVEQDAKPITGWVTLLR